MGQQSDDGKLGCGRIDGEQRPLVKQQVYDLAFGYYETVKLFGGRSPKLVLWFRIVTPGEYFDVVLPRYYNVKRVIGTPAKNGDFKVGQNSGFLREYVTLFHMPHRADRIPMSVFPKHLYKGKVKTVVRGFNQRKIPKQLQYSVISELIEVKVP